MKMNSTSLITFGLCVLFLTPGVKADPPPECVTVWFHQAGSYIGVLHFNNYISGNDDTMTLRQGHTGGNPVKKGSKLTANFYGSTGALTIDGKEFILANKDMAIHCDGGSDTNISTNACQSMEIKASEHPTICPQK